MASTHNVLVRAIRHAEANDRVGRNVASLVKPPQGKTGRPSRAMTAAEAAALLAAAKDHPRVGAYVILSLTTGIRTEEARALRWDHVDLDGDPDARTAVPPSIAVWRSVRLQSRETRRLSTSAGAPVLLVALSLISDGLAVPLSGQPGSQRLPADPLPQPRVQGQHLWAGPVHDRTVRGRCRRRTRASRRGQGGSRCCSSGSSRPPPGAPSPASAATSAGRRPARSPARPVPSASAPSSPMPRPTCSPSSPSPAPRQIIDLQPAPPGPPSPAAERPEA